MRRAAPRRGFAAVLALCMLAALGGAAAASFYPVVEARRAAARFVRQEEAASVADAALHWALDTWDVRQRDSLPIGATDSLIPVLEPGPDPMQARVRVIHLTKRLFWIEASGEVGGRTSLEAYRAYRLLAAVLAPAFPALAAVISRGEVLAGRETVISGDDTPPPGWSDCPAPAGSGGPEVLVPPDPAADSATFEVFGRVTATSLAGRADVVVPGASTLAPAPEANSDCRTDAIGGASSNWGDPKHTGRSASCERFFPVIHATGDLTVTGGRGQGVLLVDGRLRISGPFLFAGVVIARGGIETTGEGVELYGTVLSADRSGAMLRAAGTVRRSTCAIGRASDGAIRLFPERLGGWAEVF